jgi:type I restriction enzyme M protein
MKMHPMGTILFPKSGASTFLNHRAMMGVNGFASSHLATIKGDSEKILDRFLYYMLIDIDAKNLTADQSYPSLKLGDISKIRVPVPPLEVQEQIVAELDGYAAIISGANQIVENWKPQIEVDPDWAIVPLGEVCDVRDGTHDSPKYQQAGIPLITSKNLKNDSIDFSDVKYITEDDHHAISKRSKVDDGDLLMAMIGTIVNAVLVQKEQEFSIKNVALFKLGGSKTLNNRFLLYLLKSRFVENNLFSQQKGVTQKFLALGDLRNFGIPLPDMSVQESIVAEIESEKEQVDSAKKLIETYAAKIQAVIAKLWSE